jgi:predicted transcriptional regulator
MSGATGDARGDARDDATGGARDAVVERLRRDISDLERHLVDMPPHHAGGTRRAAEERLEDLQQDLARAIRATDGHGTRGAPA